MIDSGSFKASILRTFTKILSSQRIRGTEGRSKRKRKEGENEEHEKENSKSGEKNKKKKRKRMT